MQDVSPTKHALLIGIDNYPYLSPERQLHGCTNDVVLLSDILSKRFEFATHNISCLRNEQATREGILKAFKDLIEAVQRDDVVVVHYSGHGSAIPDADKGAGWTETIVPYDSGRKLVRRSTDIEDREISGRLLEPLVRKTPFVTLIFDCCHSGSILREARDAFGTAVRGIEPGEPRKNCGVEGAPTSRWFPRILAQALRDLKHERYTLLAACRANEKAVETSVDGTTYGTFTYHLCNVLNESHGEEIHTLFQLASRKVTARYPNQHPILEGAQNASIFGAIRFETPRNLGIRRIYDTGGAKMLDMDGGLASGVTQGSIWAVRPVGAPPGHSDAQITVEEVLPFVSRAKVTRPGNIKDESRCFEVSHVYGNAVLNIALNDEDPRFRRFLSKLRDHAGTLNVVQEISKSDVELVFLEKSTVAEGDWVPQLGPLEDETCVAISRDGRLLLPPTTDLSIMCENLRKLARYRFGLGLGPGLHNPNKNENLLGKLILQLKWRPKGSTGNDPWKPAEVGEDGFPLFRNEDQIACVIRNNSNVKVWPYVLLFGADGSVMQRYPGRGGEEGLEAGSSTKEVAAMELDVSTENAFQLAEYGVLKATEGKRRRQVTVVLKLFASTEPISFSLLLQGPFVLRESSRGLSGRRQGDLIDENDVPLVQAVSGWESVNAAFIIESDISWKTRYGPPIIERLLNSSLNLRKPMESWKLGHLGVKALELMNQQ